MNENKSFVSLGNHYTVGKTVVKVSYHNGHNIEYIEVRRQLGHRSKQCQCRFNKENLEKLSRKGRITRKRYHLGALCGSIFWNLEQELDKDQSNHH